MRIQAINLTHVFRRAGVSALLIMTACFGCSKPTPPPAPITKTPSIAKPSTTSDQVAPAENASSSKPQVAESPSMEPPAKPKEESSAAVEDSKPAAPGSSDVAIVAAQPVPPPNDCFVIFTPGGPLIVELQVLVHNQALTTAAEHVLDETLKAVATSESGPTWNEVLAAPTIVSGQLGNSPINDRTNKREIIKQFDSNRDALCQRDELASYLSQNNTGGQTFSVRSGNDLRNDVAQDSPVFRLLDEDRDGQVSEPEMADATRKLQSRDANDNEVVITTDFLSYDTPERPRPRRRSNFTVSQASVLNEYSTDAIFYALCELNGVNELGPEDFRFVPQRLASLDQDESGTVGQLEIKGLLNAEPDLSLKVSFGGKDRSPPTLELLALGEQMSAIGAETLAAPGRLNLDLSNWTLEIATSDQAGDNGAPSMQLQAQFATLDANKDDLLEADELTILGPTAEVTLKQLDGDSDGKLSVTELQTPTEKTPQAYRSLQVQARVGQAEDPLFSWLDSKQDGRLTLREMRTAGQRLAELDQDKDGIVGAAEVPQRMTCEIIRGATSQNMQNQTLLTPIVPPSVDGAAVPRWMTAMDQNGDGELSPNEFLGPPQEFKRLDKNADGFLDSTETD
jgi:hypothetical protein